MFWWFKAFAEERASVEGEPPSGRRLFSGTDANVDRLRDLVCADHQNDWDRVEFRVTSPFIRY